MTGVTVLAVYRPKPGKAAELDRLVAGHLAILRAEGLACDYLPIGDLPEAKQMFSPFTRVTL
jgi:hypothetical protein